ncbi:MAG: glycosyltransferase [Ramlibacter sp.]|nr:glycosyltransferase [Ramlibacter sp.]
MTRALTVLMTNITLGGRTGTEIQTRNIALELLRQGHKPLVYTPVSGPIADELRAGSVPVVTDLTNVAQPVDIIHGHHLPTTLIAVARFPESPAIFVCHDFMAWHDSPPLLPAVRRYVAVDETVHDRLTLESGIPQARVRVVLNVPDIRRFLPGPALPPWPKRALAFAKNQGHVAAITAACAQRGIHLDVVGQAAGRVVEAPERLLPDYDLVFTSALSAMEAMACGRAVVVCDGRGLAGMCDVECFLAWRRLNFGLRTLRLPVTPETVGMAIDRYDATAAGEVGAQLRAEGGLDAYVRQLTGLYDEVLEEHRRAPHSVADLSRALATQLQNAQADSAALPWLRERQLLLDRLDEVLYGTTCAPLDSFLAFGTGETRRWWKKIRGFSHPEDWGTWSDGSMAIAMFRVAEAGELRAELVLHPFVPDNKRELTVTVTVNGLLMDTWRFRGPDTTGPRTRSLRIPQDAVGQGGVIWLAFAIKNALSPRQLGLSDDARALGIGLHGVTLHAAR